MYSSSDFEHLLIRYKAEGLPEGESLQASCLKKTKHPTTCFTFEGISSCKRPKMTSCLQS